MKNKITDLQHYFDDYYKNCKHNVDFSYRDWNEFRNKSLLSERNILTEKINKEFRKTFPSSVRNISDNVKIVASLRDLIDEIMKDVYILADREALSFVSKVYNIQIQDYEIIYIDEIVNGEKLNSIVSDFKKSSYQKILAIGGGRTMDYAKFLSYVSNKTLIGIPSSLATHVYASPKIHALEPIKELGFELTIDGDPAHLVFIDTHLLNLLYKENKRLVYSGFGDIMAFINARRDWKYSAENGNERYSKFVDDSITFIIDQLVNIDINQAITNWIADYIFIQCLLCHITDWVGSAPASGAEHLFAKCIEDESENQIFHGEIVALGVLIFSYIRNKDISISKSLMRKFEITTDLANLGLSKNMIIDSLYNSQFYGLKKRRYTIIQELDNSKEFYSFIVDRMLEEGLLE